MHLPKRIQERAYVGSECKFPEEGKEGYAALF
jgi:hypothetical protein